MLGDHVDGLGVQQRLRVRHRGEGGRGRVTDPQPRAVAGVVVRVQRARVRRVPETRRHAAAARRGHVVRTRGGRDVRHLEAGHGAAGVRVCGVAEGGQRHPRPRLVLELREIPGEVLVEHQVLVDPLTVTARPPT